MKGEHTSGAAASRRTLFAAIVATTLAVLPITLVGAQAVLLREELGFSEGQLGLAVSVWYLTAAAMSMPGGLLGERLGARTAMLTASTMSALCLLGIAVVAQRWWQLLLFLIVGGAGNALAQPAINLSVARGIPLTRQGLAFGIKQGSIPIATLVAGATVPLVGLTIGWRWAFALGALVALLFWVISPATPTNGGHRRERPTREGDMAVFPVALLGVAGGFGVGATTSLTAFYVESAVANGIAVGTAGALLAVGSATGVACRVLLGWRSDRWGRSLFAVMWLLVGGGVGFFLLAFADSWVALMLGTAFAFAAGWGWPGLLQHAVVRHNPRAPAAATGILMTGNRTGGMLGPAIFGLLVERASFSTAWTVFAGVLITGAVLMRVARFYLRRDILARGGTLSQS